VNNFFSIVCTDYSNAAGVRGTLDLLSIFGTGRDAISLLGKILHISEIDEGSSFKIEVTFFSTAFHGVIDPEEVF
jgi:hypothetical protein